MIKKIICLLLALSCIFQTGCWDRRETTDLAIVIAAGIDSDPAGVRLTMQIARPRAFAGGAENPGGQPKENNVWVVSGAGRTVLDAQRLLGKKISRDIYWGHDIIIVFGEEIAREGIRKVINFFSRSSEARETVWVFLTSGKAEEFLNSHSQLENTSAQAAGNMARIGIGIQVMFKDLRIMLASKGTNPVLPRLELAPAGQPQGPGFEENIPATKGKQEETAKVHAEITLTGTGVFKDDKLVGWLDRSETRGLLWLKDQMHKGVITVPSPAEPGKKISVYLIRADTKVEPYRDGENIWFDVKIDLIGDLLEQQSAEDITNLQVFETIEKEVARDIEAKARAALKKAQFDYGVDIFAFGEAFHRKYKNEWNRLKAHWDQVFSGAGVNITVNPNIRRTGLTTKRVSIPEQ